MNFILHIKTIAFTFGCIAFTYSTLSVLYHCRDRIFGTEEEIERNIRRRIARDDAQSQQEYFQRRDR